MRSGKVRDREKTAEQLRRALQEVKNQGRRVSISAVAVAAGVTPALIHNTYPDIAEAIRAEVGRTTHARLDSKARELDEARDAMRTLKAELAEARADIDKLASINETLRDQVSTLKAQLSGRLVTMPTRGPIS